MIYGLDYETKTSEISSYMGLSLHSVNRQQGVLQNGLNELGTSKSELIKPSQYNLLIWENILFTILLFKAFNFTKSLFM
jgi:hypothetical protein